MHDGNCDTKKTQQEKYSHDGSIQSDCKTLEKGKWTLVQSLEKQ